MYVLTAAPARVCCSYELGDLVELGEQDVGMVVGISMQELSVLRTTGDDVVKVRVAQVRTKLNAQSGRAQALDANQKQVSEGDVVRITSGPAEGLVGTVRRIHRAQLFVKVDAHHSNAGIVVVRGRWAVLANAKVCACM